MNEEEAVFTKPKDEVVMKNNQPTIRLMLFIIVCSFMAVFQTVASACTGITLRAIDGTVVYGRTLECGMIGLPGDFTPPSRFVRAVAFSMSARPTADGPETIYEVFRILDNFNIPLGASEGSGATNTAGMRSSTLWTSAHDLANKVMYYHTQHNRQVRMIDIRRLNFDTIDEIQTFPLDEQKIQAIKDRTPQ